MKFSNSTTHSKRKDAIRAEVHAAMARNPLCDQLTTKTVRALEKLEVGRRIRAELEPGPSTVAWYYNPVYVALGFIVVLGLALRCLGIPPSLCGREIHERWLNGKGCATRVLAARGT